MLFLDKSCGLFELFMKKQIRCEGYKLLSKSSIPNTRAEMKEVIKLWDNWSVQL